MSTSFRLALVVGVGVILFAAPLIWAALFQRDFRARYARAFRESEAARGNVESAGLSDAEIWERGDGGMEVTANEIALISLASAVFKLWWAWLIVLAAMCLGLNLMLRVLAPVRVSPPGM